MKRLNRILFLLVLFFCPAGLSAQQPGTKNNKSIQQQVNKYFSLAKAYGYIHYFYPGDAAAAIDWDKFAYYCAKTLGEDLSPDYGVRLNSLFKTIAPEIRIQKAATLNTGNTNRPASGQLSQPVYWQHLGDGKGSIGYPYKSMRVNRPARILPESPDDFGWLRKKLPAEEYSGKELRFSIAIQADPLYNGFSNLVVSILPQKGNRLIFSTEGQPIATGKWSRHSVIVKVPDSVKTITLGLRSATLTGTIQYDNLVIEVKEAAEWKVISKIDFDEMREEDLAATWQATGPNNVIYLKKEGNNQWVNFSRAQGVLKESSPLFDQAPKPNEWMVKDIGHGLSLSFPMLLYSDQMRSAGTDYTELKLAMAALPADDYAAGNVYTRIANVMILWNKIQHFHPGNPMSQAQWEKQLRNALLRSLSDSSLEEHRKTLTQMIAPLNDSHMVLYYSVITRTDFLLPIEWEQIAGKIIVTEVFDSTLPILPGDRITHIDGRPAKNYWKEMETSVTGATASRKQYRARAESVRGIKGSSIRIKTAKNNEELVLERTLSEADINTLRKKKQQREQYQQLEPGIVYVNLSQISWTDLQARLTELAAANGIIFDLRGYPNWQTHRIVSHFIHEPIHQMKSEIPEIVYPDKENMKFSSSGYSDTLFPRSPYISGAKVFLTNGSAISYSEDFLNLVSYYKLADIVGEQTAGTTGTVNMCYLFGGISVPWTGMQVFRQDGKLFNGMGVIPTHPVKKTINAVVENRDEYLEQALKIIRRHQQRP